MKLFTCMVLAAGFFSQAAAEVWVPGVGSEWKSTSTYASTAEDGSPPRIKTDVVKVERMEDGRPVFSGKIFGYEGEIVETSEGTTVYALECKSAVPAEKLLPPAYPNQCVWHVCHAPVIGVTFTRVMTIYAPIFACAPQMATYTFTSVRESVYNGAHVTAGNVEVTFNGVRRGAWESYIEDGVGEIFAESSEKVTIYSRVRVSLVPYKR